MNSYFVHVWVWPPTGREDRERRRVEDWTEMILFVHMCCFFFFSFLCHVAHSGRGRYLLHLGLIHPCMCVCWPIKLLAVHASISLFL